jgi:hypothetical protein
MMKVLLAVLCKGRQPALGRMSVMRVLVEEVSCLPEGQSGRCLHASQPASQPASQASQIPLLHGRCSHALPHLCDLERDLCSGLPKRHLHGAQDSFGSLVVLDAQVLQ